MTASHYDNITGLRDIQRRHRQPRADEGCDAAVTLAAPAKWLLWHRSSTLDAISTQHNSLTHINTSTANLIRLRCI